MELLLEVGFPAIEQMAETVTMGYYLPAGPTWIEDPKATLGYDMADCWASCMIPFDWGLQYDPEGSCSSQNGLRYMLCRWMRMLILNTSIRHFILI